MLKNIYKALINKELYLDLNVILKKQIVLERKLTVSLSVLG